jgi:hypothetical protein
MTIASTAAALDVHNPSDGRSVATVKVNDRESVNAMADGLRVAQGAWAETAPRERATWTHRWRDWISAHTDELTDLLQGETGRSAPTRSCRRQRHASSPPAMKFVPGRLATGLGSALGADSVFLTDVDMGARQTYLDRIRDN